MRFRSYDFWKDPPLYLMGKALRILYNQTFFVLAWNIYLSDDCGQLLMLALTCPCHHRYSLLASKIQAIDARNYIILFLGSALGPYPGIIEPLESLLVLLAMHLIPDIESNMFASFLKSRKSNFTCRLNRPLNKRMRTFSN